MTLVQKKVFSYHANRLQLLALFLQINYKKINFFNLFDENGLKLEPDRVRYTYHSCLCMKTLARPRGVKLSNSIYSNLHDGNVEYIIERS